VFSFGAVGSLRPRLLFTVPHWTTVTPNWPKSHFIFEEQVKVSRSCEQFMVILKFWVLFCLLIWSAALYAAILFPSSFLLIYSYKLYLYVILWENQKDFIFCRPPQNINISRILQSSSQQTKKKPQKWLREKGFEDDVHINHTFSLTLPYILWILNKESVIFQQSTFKSKR
jgi:hypothetical protein